MSGDNRGISQRSERRTHRRARLDRPVLLRAADQGAEHPVRALDISASGLSIVTSSPRSARALVLGAVVDVYVELPIRVAIDARAEVVRQDADCVALRFVELAQQDAVAIRSYCRLSNLHERAKLPIPANENHPITRLELLPDSIAS